jgi:hypothetical protein
MLNGNERKANKIDKEEEGLEEVKKNEFLNLDPNDLYFLCPLKINGYYKNKKWKETKIRDFKEVISILRNFDSFFKNSKTLEINCGDGQFCFNYFIAFKPKKHIAIDFNFSLLEKALDLKENLVEIEELNKNSDEKEFLKFLEDCPKNLLVKQNMKHFEELYKNKFIKQFFRKLISDYEQKIDFKKIENKIFFKFNNFFSFRYQHKFEVIFCFSFIKYFHFTFGDDIIPKLFTKIKNMLENKGVLVIDLISIKFYAKFLKKNPKAVESIKMMPNDILDLLQKKFKFIPLFSKKIPLKKYHKKIHILLSYT